MIYTNWTYTHEDEVITVTADREGSVNPALKLIVNKETGAVVVEGSPDLLALQSDGKARQCRLELFEYLFSAHPDSIQVGLDREKGAVPS